MSVLLSESLDTTGKRYPRTSRIVRQILERSPMLLRGQLTVLIRDRGDAFWPEAERLIALSEDTGHAPADSLIEYTVTYLREQIRFMRTKEYSQSDFEAARRDVYDNPEVMEKCYPHGLMLATRSGRSTWTSIASSATRSSRASPTTA